VVLRRFSLRKGSGGEGRFKGGDGVIREVGMLGFCLLSCMLFCVLVSPSGA
jgi:N-methylhydantoinase B/oxoprolinase/acetone carboxylase alpha subunit